jgi:hypothetical protein
VLREVGKSEEIAFYIEHRLDERACSARAAHELSPVSWASIVKRAKTSMLCSVDS